MSDIQEIQRNQRIILWNDAKAKLNSIIQIKHPSLTMATKDALASRVLDFIEKIDEIYFP